ncbi:putative cell polarity protein [Aspergillus mulundensis]|uniref:Polarisome component (SpaA) n=1 Tax=Aspergillus mulundensis TaxID=1810919 RepID=A0A3D8T5R9_9EURO|nr:Polarisome component (SpaA) [Aspergillus mulundensis]RDW93916.1 Polarisome component (SpaA) [Aspergillus mulundensis]
MSPVSVDGSDWSGLNQYQKSDAPFSPTFSSRSNLATPPTSGVPTDPNGTGVPSGSSSQLSDSGNPSPPNSVAARSSNGTLGDQRSRRQRQVEEILAQHYSALRRFLYSSYRDERSNRKSSKAQDKLLRLSPTQFHELSTDVYDELLRRQQAMPSPNRPARPEVPPFLPPRSDFHEKRNQARQKLASLQHQRFRDLGADVFNELERRFPHFPARDSRRASPAPSLRGRPPPNGLGPGGYPPPPGSRRSQSRGPPRMGRGYPSGGPPGSPMYPPRKMSLSSNAGMNGEGPMAKSFQSNMIVPNKSTMVEDDDDGAGTEDEYDSRSDAFALDSFIRSRRGTGTTIGESDRKLLADTQSQVSTLQEKVSKLEELLKTKDQEISKFQEGRQEVDKLEELLKEKEEEISRYQEDQDKSQVSNAERQEWDGIKYELENKIHKAEDLNSSLQLELEKVRAEHEAVERDLQGQLSGAPRREGGDAELQAQFADLEIKHQKLQMELREQQQVTEEVRREAAGFLMEMRELSEQSHSRLEHEERLSEEVHKLEDELNVWKGRYAKAKAQLRHLRTSSAGISDLRSDVNTVAKDNEFLHEDGVIKDVHVTKFQISIDELIRIARSDDHQHVMQQIKAVVISVRHILQDVQQTKHAESAECAKATRKVSATANNLITASKNFTSSSGLSPISLLDAAASHMSTAVIDLIRLVKIRPTPADELNDDDEDLFAQMKSPDYFSVAPSQSRMSNGSFYVEDQADGLVQSIQSLVASIRGEESMTTIRTHVSAIASIVTNVASSTDHLITKPDTNQALRQRAGASIETLEYQRSRLVGAAAEGEGAADPEQLRTFTNQLPPIAFEIARETKELVQRLDMTDHGDAEDDDFR